MTIIIKTLVFEKAQILRSTWKIVETYITSTVQIISKTLG